MHTDTLALFGPRRNKPLGYFQQAPKNLASMAYTLPSYIQPTGSAEREAF